MQGVIVHRGKWLRSCIGSYGYRGKWLRSSIGSYGYSVHSSNSNNNALSFQTYYGIDQSHSSFALFHLGRSFRNVLAYMNDYCMQCYQVTALVIAIVGRIGEKMFTSGRMCTFFHEIAQYYANAGNPDRQYF